MTNTALVICDAGPLIHLDELDNLSLFNDFAQVLVPEQVWLEVEQHRPKALAQPDLSFQRVKVAITSKPAFQTLVSALSLDLVHGTIGILLRAVRRHQRTQEEVLAILRSVPVNSTLHIRPKLLQDIVTRLGSQL